MKTKNIWIGVLIIACLFNFELSAQKMVEDYSMVFTLSMTPVRGQEKALKEALKMHNEKFHKEGKFAAWVQEVLTGQSAGDYVWLMGPSMFRDYDNRPEIAGHDGDWQTNIDKMVEKYGPSEYWKKDGKLSFTPENEGDNKYTQVWILDIAKGQWLKFNSLMEKILAVNKKRGEGMNIYTNEFSSGDGRDVALVWGIKSWSEMDIDDPLKNHYEAMYGKDSWAKFLEDWFASVDKVSQALWKVAE